MILKTIYQWKGVKMSDYSIMHKDCENNCEGYCSKYDYIEVSKINNKCDKYKKKVKK